MNHKFQESEYLGKIENLAIRITTREDAALLCKWWSDGKVMAHAGFPNGKCRELGYHMRRWESN